MKLTYMNKTKGFTLIEVMIIIVVIGILAAVAWPLYETQQIKARRADGANALNNARQALIAFRTDNGTYPATTGAADAALGNYKPAANDATPTDCKSNRGYLAGTLTSCDGRYTIAVTAVNVANETYTITATPGFNDTECTTLTLDNLGTKDSTGTGPVTRCWAE